MTFRDAFRNQAKVKINGQAWDAWNMNPAGTEVILLRSVRVKSHWKGNRYIAGGIRHVAIRRPADATV